MDEDLDRLVVRVRADTGGFARDIAAMRAQLDGPLLSAADAAGRGIETALLRATRTGRVGFDDLRKVALSVLADIAASAIRSGIDAILGGGRSSGGGLLSTVGSLFGAPGRATGGPVSPGRAFVVGERGPELFVPTASGRIEPGPGSAAPARDIRIAISIAAPAGTEPQALARSSRQIARAVRASLVEGQP